MPGRIARACAALGLPTHISCGLEDCSAAIGLDKKSAGSDITLILLDAIGHAVPCKMPRERLLAQVAALPGHGKESAT